MFILGTNVVSEPPRIEYVEKLRRAARAFNEPLKVVVESEHFRDRCFVKCPKLAVDFSMGVRYSVEEPRCAGSLTIQQSANSTQHSAKLRSPNFKPLGAADHRDRRSTLRQSVPTCVKCTPISAHPRKRRAWTGPGWDDLGCREITRLES